MKLVRTYLLENGTFPSGIGAGSTVKPNGKTLDAWATVSYPMALCRGKTPTMSREPLNGHLMRSQGYVIRVHVWDIG